MSRTYINMSAAGSANSTITKAKNKVVSAKNSFCSTKNAVDDKIKGRNNISGRLNSIQNQLGDIEYRISCINQTVQNGLNMYQNTEKTIDTQARNIINTLVSKTAMRSALEALFNGALKDEKAKNPDKKTASDTDIAQDNITKKKFSDYLKMLSGSAELVGKKSNSEVSSLAGGILGYFGDLYGVYENRNSSGAEISSSILSLIKSSGGVETGLFDYYLDKLNPFAAMKLDSKFGNTMGGVKVVSGLAGVGVSLSDVYKTYNDPNSTTEAKTASWIRVINPVAKLGKDIYFSKTAKPYLHYVFSAGGNSKVRNQILTSERKLVYDVGKTQKIKMKNVGTYITIGTSYVDAIAGGYEQYGKLSADGKIDGADIGSIGTHGATEGITSMISSLTFGLIDLDGKKIADHLEADAKEFAHGDSWAANFIRDENKWAPARFAVSVGSGVYIIGENLYEGAKTATGYMAGTAKTIIDWFK